MIVRVGLFCGLTALTGLQLHLKKINSVKTRKLAELRKIKKIA